MKINVLHCNAATVATAKALYERANANFPEDQRHPPWGAAPMEYQSAWCAVVAEAKKLAGDGWGGGNLADCQFEVAETQLPLSLEVTEFSSQIQHMPISRHFCPSWCGHYLALDMSSALDGDRDYNTEECRTAGMCVRGGGNFKP